ncbi:hypothetical protein JL720_5930 [Aureococcus anophagefferens]|nr:hypothetical protein JL720_5930 [Aureococcus anophagefferens]
MPEAARPVEGRDAFAPCAPGDVGFDALGRRVCLLEIPGALAAPPAATLPRPDGDAARPGQDKGDSTSLQRPRLRPRGRRARRGGPSPPRAPRFRVKRHVSRADGCLIVVDARRDALDTVGRWRRLVGAAPAPAPRPGWCRCRPGSASADAGAVGSLKSECPVLLLLNDWFGGGGRCALADDEITRRVDDLGIIGWRMCGCARADDDDSVLDAFGALLDYCHATAPLPDEVRAEDEDDDLDPSLISCSNTNVQGCAVA